jgi:immune inhibitor A
MISRCFRSAFVLTICSALALGIGLALQPVQAQTAQQPDLGEYLTVDQAKRTQISKGSSILANAASYLGIHAVAEPGGKVMVGDVEPTSPAAAAGVQPGDQLLSVFNQIVNSAEMLRELVKTKSPGEAVQIGILRGTEQVNLTATLAAASKVLKAEPAAEGGTGGKGGGGFGKGAGKAWKKDTYRLAIIGVDYPDVKRNPKITDKDWEESMFSIGTYNKTSVTGEKVYGSMNDYYKEQSFGKLNIVGKMFDFIQVSKKRTEYTNKTALFNEAMEKLLVRDGQDALKDLDGVFFIYAGKRPPNTPRGGLYWPHRSNFNFQGKNWPYFIVDEGGTTMQNTSVFCHEFGHMLGLPDLYARPENPGSEGVWQWCAMANQIGQGHPQHFCAWSKEQVGWITPCVIDPAVKQKLILAPIEDSPKECFKVLVRPDGSEYFLLENRKKKGFDSKLPGEGLLVWRVVGNRPILEESHGVEGPSGPRVFLKDVPYPSPSNDSFTPFTIPSSRSQLGGGLPVYITNIRRLPDGRIAFHIGYEYY